MRYVNTTMNPEAALRDLGSRDPAVRVRAADALAHVEAELKGPAAEALRPLLTDDESDVRYAAALALGELRDAASVDALLEVCTGDGHPLPRQAAVIALGLIGEPRAARPLAELIRDAPADVRFQAVTSLVQVDPGAASGPLCQALADTDDEVRAAAAAGLGDLGQAENIPALVAALGDRHPAVTLEAALGLARLGDASGTPRLLAALSEREQRLLAAEHLFYCPDPRARARLDQLLGRWLSPALLKVWVAGALLRLDPEHAKARATLLASLQNRHDPVCGLAIQVLGELGVRWGQEALDAFGKSPRGERWREEVREALDPSTKAP